MNFFTETVIKVRLRKFPVFLMPKLISREIAEVKKKFWFDFIKILTPLWFFSKTWTLSPPTKDASQRKTRKKKSRILYCDIYKFTYYIFLFLLTTYCWNKLAKHSRIMQSFQNLQPGNQYTAVLNVTILHKVDLD